MIGSNLRKWLWLVVIVPGICSQLFGCATLRILSLVQSGEPVPMGKSAVITLPFEMKGHTIFVKVKLNSDPREFNFILDTGAFSIINQRLAEELKLAQMEEVQAKGTGGGGQQAHLTKLDILAFGGATVRKCPAIILDLKNLEKFAGVKIDGLLGSNVLRYFVVTIDYGHKYLTISDQNVGKETDEKRIVLPFEQEITMGFAPKVKCVLDGKHELAGIIDTGADHSMVDYTLFQKEKALFSAYRNVSGQIVGGAFKLADQTVFLQARSFEMGPIRLENLPLLGISSDRKTTNQVLIGKDILRNYVFTLDYPKKKMYLIPQEPAAFSHRWLTTGVAFKWNEKEQVVIGGLVQGSPAEKAGLALGEEVLEVNGRSSLDYSMLDLVDLTNNDQVPEIELLIKNASGEKKIVLKKVDLFSAKD
jgi:hypothetical protein